MLLIKLVQSDANTYLILDNLICSK